MKTFDNNFWIIFISFIFLIIIILFFPYFFSQFHAFSFDFTETGQIGDTLGGILGPFIAIGAAILTFFAFWVQFKANEQQKADLKIERFENKFYALVEIHRNNVSEISIGNSLHGRKAFISMFNELKFTYYVVVEYYEKKYKPLGLDQINEDILYNISYLIFFFGVGPNSSLIILDMIDKKLKGFFLCIEEEIKMQQSAWRMTRKKNEKFGVEFRDQIFELNVKYIPCNGQMSKLSHYVRHLFQLVKFVDDAEERIFTYEDKYNYIATVRSQLSAHEQLLLYYNAVSVMGKPWLDKPNYLKKYCVVKSLPLPLADFYKKPLDLLGRINENNKIIFEWGEIKNRLMENS